MYQYPFSSFVIDLIFFAVLLGFFGWVSAAVYVVISAAIELVKATR